jgi:hypothetical protein
VFDGPEFIAAVVQHIPPPGFQMVRYYGWYSNRARGERRKLGLVEPGADVEESQVDMVLDVADYRQTRAPSKTWRKLVARADHPETGPFRDASEPAKLCPREIRSLTKAVIAKT